MSDNEKLTPERAVRLLRAKVHELEQRVLDRQVPSILDLTADIALIAQLLADHIERSERHDEQLRQMYKYLADRTTEVDWEKFDKWLDEETP